MKCQYCFMETPCGHEQEIKRLKEAVEEAKDIFKDITFWDGGPLTEVQPMCKQWLAKHSKDRPKYDPEEDEYPE